MAKSKNVYDQFIITAGVFNEFNTTDPKLDEHVGIIAFDRDDPYKSISDHNTLKFQISDHRPIWIRLQIDGGDDD